MKLGFDNEIYIQKQTDQIIKRLNQFSGKLYLEFGGKLFDDYHASRVLPGFDMNAKINILKKLSDRAEIIFSISASDIESNKIRADMGITYDLDVLRLMDDIRATGLLVSGVVITQYSGQTSADIFRKKLQHRGEKVYTLKFIDGYPSNTGHVVSDEGFGKNDYIETTRPLVVITAPGPGSGKMAACLSQLYHEYKRGINAGYAKFETFPIWNLAINHPVNIAYEAATADLKDVNMIDSFHLEAYEEKAVNYNRDIEVFPVVKTILKKIGGCNADIYRSPTDMGVNMAGFCITDDEVVSEAAKQEILRRYYKSLCDYKQGRVDIETSNKIELLINKLNLDIKNDRPVVQRAADKAAEKGVHVLAIQLPDGGFITGKSSDVLNCVSGAIINVIKKFAGIDDDIHLLSPKVLEPILQLKKSMNSKCLALNLEETLIALSICAATDNTVAKALEQLPLLKGCEAHASCMILDTDETFCRKLGLNLTCEAEFASKDLYYF